MHFKTFAFITFLAPAALADFVVYCGNNCVNDGAGCPNSCIFFNNPPESCEEVIDSVAHNQSQDNDASSSCGGLACDGCEQSENARDWTITRLEINNSQGCTPSTLHWSGGGDDPHFTIWDTDGRGEIRDTDNNVLGYCEAATDPKDEHDCFAGVSSRFFVHAFTCTSDLEYTSSVN